ncbi:hypothetical protein MKY30_09795 [Oceanobacillus sp. FSL W8-0428]|uniref:hypothetical protein n=1 Tax=Oceanobacillus sp. FSL W8-0428 TaxID=2921715 RepID=UPI0030F6B74A
MYALFAYGFTNRHLDHIVKEYYKDKTTIKNNETDNLLNYNEFIHRCKTRGYEKFALGKLYEIDVTYYSNVNYPSLIAEVKKQIVI